MSSIILLLMLAVMVTSHARQTALSLAQAQTQRSAQQVFFLAEQSLHNALSQEYFVRDPMAATLSAAHHANVSTVTELTYFGPTERIPHRNFDADTHRAWHAHWFSARATVTTATGGQRWHERVFVVIGPTSLAPDTRLAGNSTEINDIFGDTVLPLSWRAGAE
ncbi:MAG: hypothetical protein AAF270_14980 [Pseudomonadota bacterium]